MTRFHVLGLVIIACGLALCYGAAQLWPAAASSLSVTGVLRIITAVVAAVLGVANVGAGFAVLFVKPARA